MGKRIHSQIQAVSLDNGAVIHDDEAGSGIPVGRSRSPCRPVLKDFSIRRVHYDSDLFHTTRPLGKHFFTGFVHSNDEISETNAEFFKPTYDPDLKAGLINIEDRHDQFWHRIVLIEDNLCAQHFWK